MEKRTKFKTTGDKMFPSLTRAPKRSAERLGVGEHHRGCQRFDRGRQLTGGLRGSGVASKTGWISLELKWYVNKKK